jgi:hypothetical protein
MNPSLIDRSSLRLLPLILAASLLIVLSAVSLAQTQPANSNKSVISGRVVADDGAGLPGITVSLAAPGKGQLTRRTTSTDEEGNFRFAELPRGAYSLSTFSGRAYVPAPVVGNDRTQLRLYRLGETASIQMIKGGVITGKVTNASDEALIALPLSAIMVRNADGQAISGQTTFNQAFTDDRGIYRFYGLSPGTYIVVANNNNTGSSSQTALYERERPTYYPSSTRDTAVEVQVASGGEATGIDIRYRGESGSAISGKVSGNKLGVYVTLMDAGAGTQLATSYNFRTDSEIGFEFYGLADGEYEIIARNADSSTDQQWTSTPLRVTVKGGDRTGLELRMQPLGSIAGRVVIETASSACDKSRKTFIEEIGVSARPGEKQKDEADSSFRPNRGEAVLNEKGEFEIRPLNAHHYWFSLNLPREDLFVRSVVLGQAMRIAPVPRGAPNPVADLSRSGVLLKQGEKLTGVAVMVAEGGVSLRGQIVPEKTGAPLPLRMRAYLVPTETTAADEVIRYAETFARSDGSFTLTNITPGKYWFLARAVPDDEPADNPPPPVSWNAAERAKLRREAEAAKNEIELKACQRLTDQVMKYYAPK